MLYIENKYKIPKYTIIVEKINFISSYIRTTFGVC